LELKVNKLFWLLCSIAAMFHLELEAQINRGANQTQTYYPPQQGYQQPANYPPQQVTQTPAQYTPPPAGYATPPAHYTPPPANYTAPPAGYAPPPAGHTPPPPAKTPPKPVGKVPPPAAPTPSTPPPLNPQEGNRPQLYYTEPGIVGYQNGRWIGSDHLYNLSSHLGVYVEIVRLPNVAPVLDLKTIENEVMDILTKGGLYPTLMTGGPTPPFPYYHVLIMTMPMPEGKIACVSCRLFEQVQLQRVQLAEGVYWQAITWEKQTLVEAAKEEFPAHIYKDVAQITSYFVQRFKHFEELKMKFGQ
jgi:hypothetical protein